MPADCIRGDIRRKTFRETNSQHHGGTSSTKGSQVLTACRNYHHNSELSSHDQAHPKWILHALMGGSFSFKPSGGKSKRRKDHSTLKRVRKKNWKLRTRVEEMGWGLAPELNEDKWAANSGEYIFSPEHLPLHQSPAKACQAGVALLCICRLCSCCHSDGAISHVCCCCTEALWFMPAQLGL